MTHFTMPGAEQPQAASERHPDREGGKKGLKPCPFCGEQMYVSPHRVNQWAACGTKDCFGSKAPVVNMDDPRAIAAWDRRCDPVRDALLAALKGGRRKMATYRNVYEGDKELRRLLDEWDAALSLAEGE